jgi:hypothetical protein
VALVLPAGPAGAATCSSAHGVSVVVDFHQLGGGVQTACVADGAGKSGTALFSSAGFALSYVQRQPGFVCRVSGLPADDRCANTPPADAYWGLWWSDGKSARWNYATTAAGGLSVPEGGYVAFSWNGSSSRSAPGLSPTAHAVAPSPTTKPSARPPVKPSGKPAGTSAKLTEKPSSGATSASASPSATPPDSASSTPRESPSKPPSKRPSKQPTSTAGGPATSPGSATPAPASAPSDPADPSDGGLPTWVGPVVVGVLFAAGGAVAVVRRRRTPTP